MINEVILTIVESAVWECNNKLMYAGVEVSADFYKRILLIKTAVI